MKMMKKVVSVVLAGAMTLAMTVSAFALTGVSAEEQKILDAAPQKAAELGIPTTSAEYQKYYSQAETYVMSCDMTTEQVNAALTAMNDATAKAKAEMDKAGVKSLLDLDVEVLRTLVADCASSIEKTLNAAGIKIAISPDGAVSLLIPNQTSDETKPDGSNNGSGSGSQPLVISNRPVVAQTGADMTATVVVAAAVIGAIAVCGVVAKKKDLFSGTEA